MKITRIILILLGVLTNIAFLYLENKLLLSSAILALIFFSFASAIHLALHECGHLIGGFMSGYKLVCIQIGPINVMADRTSNISFSTKATHGGQCIMVPKKSDSLRFKAYNLGGIIANVATCIIGATVLLCNSFYATLFFVELAFAGILKVAVNMFPCLVQSIPNDGYVVKLLNHNSAVQKDYATYLSLYAALFWGDDILSRDYTYQRNNILNHDELLYYNGIQELLESVKSSDSID